MKIRLIETLWQRKCEERGGQARSRVNLRHGARATGRVRRFAETEDTEGNPVRFQSAEFQVPVRHTKEDVGQIMRRKSLKRR